jgi:hypothetical protein
MAENGSTLKFLSRAIWRQLAKFDILKLGAAVWWLAIFALSAVNSPFAESDKHLFLWRYG